MGIWLCGELIVALHILCVKICSCHAYSLKSMLSVQYDFWVVLLCWASGDNRSLPIFSPPLIPLPSPFPRLVLSIHRVLHLALFADKMDTNLHKAAKKMLTAAWMYQRVTELFRTSGISVLRCYPCLLRLCLSLNMTLGPCCYVEVGW